MKRVKCVSEYRDLHLSVREALGGLQGPRGIERLSAYGKRLRFALVAIELSGPKVREEHMRF